MAAWHSECDHQLTDVESAQHSQRAVRSSPHTGSELSGGEITRRMLTWSHNGDLRSETRSKLNYRRFSFDCVELRDTHLPVSAPMHVGDRSTWLNSEALSRDKGFFLKREKLGYFALHMPLLGPLGVRAALSWRENFIFEKKEILDKKNIFEKKIFLFFERKILRVESCRAYTHVHRF